VSVLLVVLLFCGLVYHYTDKLDTLEKPIRLRWIKRKSNVKPTIMIARQTQNSNWLAPEDELKTIKDELKTIKSDPRVKRFLKN
jgi:hypothetical protein